VLEGRRLALGLAEFIAVAREEDERGLDMVEVVARHLAAGDKAAAALVPTNSSKETLAS
jgi:hypothetical protein